MTISKYSMKHLLILPFIFAVLMSVISVTSKAFLSNPQMRNNSMLLIFALPGHILLGAYMLWAIGKGEMLLDSIKMKFRLKDILPGVIAGISVLILSAVISLILPQKQQSSHDFVFYQMDAVLILYILFTGAIAPVIEETVFRGFLWRIFEKGSVNKYLILLITSFLFAAMHLDLYRFPALFAGGLIYGFLRMKSDSVFSPTVAHVTNNTIIVIMTLIVPLIN